MDRADFKSSSAGNLVKNLQGHWAFVPSPLPARFDWSNSLVGAVTEASAALGQLQALAQWKYLDPRRLLRLFLRREAQFSSRIENTYARVQTMLLFERIPAIEADVPD